MSTPSNLGPRLAIIALFVLPLALYLTMRSCSSPVFHTLPFEYSVINGDTVFHKVPVFSLTQVSTGATLTQDSLSGNICLIEFFSLRDTLITKIKHGHIRRFYDNVDWSMYDHLRIVSVNVGDSPAEVQAYATGLGVDLHNWMILTGDTTQLLALGQDGLRLSAFTGATGTQLPTDTPLAAFVDKQGRVRRLFDITDLGAVRKIEEDFRSILRLEYNSDIEGKHSY
ncbi:MAG: hypothetical protein SF053_00805 [Bacteroidia bacterium]|nr:hypothetical protein [Bacteroidia bacterium]